MISGTVLRARVAVLAVLVSSIFVSALPAAALSDADWIVRIGRLAWAPSSGAITTVASASALPAAGGSRFSVSDGPGIGFEVEYLVSRKLGVEVAALFGTLDSAFRLDAGSVSFTDSDELSAKAFTLGANYHFSPDRRFDLYAGGFLGIGYFDDSIFLTEVGRFEKIVFDDDTGFGVRLGVDVSLVPGGSWSLTAGVRYFLIILEGEIAGQDLDLDLWMPSIGLGYRF